MKLSEQAVSGHELDQIVSWSEIGNGPVTWREFISARASKCAERFGIEFLFKRTTKLVNELDRQQAKELVIAILANNSHDAILMGGQGPGGEGLTVDQMITEVGAETKIGKYLTKSVLDGCQRNQLLALEDMLRPASGELVAEPSSFD